MENGFIGAAIAFILGIGISFLNFRLSDFFIRKMPDKYSMVFMLRQTLGVLYIVAAYFLAPFTPWDRTYLLIGAALGVTIPMLIFTMKLLQTNEKTTIKKKEDDDNG